MKTIRQENDKELILLKCCSEYPAPYSDINMLTMVDMKNSFNVPVGFSDHTMGYMASVVAVSMGASVIEKHFCLDRNIKTPDSDFSSEPEEFREMVEAIRIGRTNQRNRNLYKDKGRRQGYDKTFVICRKTFVREKNLLKIM